MVMSLEERRRLSAARKAPPDADREQAPDRAQSRRLAQLAIARRARAGEVTAPDVTGVAQMGLSDAPASLPYRAEMEARFGADLGDVHAHLGDAAQAAARTLGAQAYTYGAAIAFADGQPSRATVAHEITHVLQQAGKGARDAATDERAAIASEHDSAETVAPAALDIAQAEAAPALRLQPREEISPAELGPLDVAAPLAEDQIASAIAYNNRRWTGAWRLALLQFLVPGPYLPEAEFGAAHVNAAARLQIGAGVAEKQVDGKIGDVTMAILLHLGLVMPRASDPVRPSNVRLIFYPGELEDVEAWRAARKLIRREGAGDPDFNEFRRIDDYVRAGRVDLDGAGRIYVRVNGRLVAKMVARGGPPVTFIDGGHTADPSRAGTYRLGAGEPHATDAWIYSQIKWGARLRETDDGGIEFLDPGARRWRRATEPGADITNPIPRSAFYNAAGELLREWNRNAFGPISWRIQGSPGLFIHTTPYSERVTLAGEDPELSYSHGCLHVEPAERDAMQAAGYLQGGVTLEIKRYEQHLLPEEMRDLLREEP